MMLYERKANSIENEGQLQPLVIATVFPALATSAVVLRMISKRMIKAPWSIDDFMILAALFFIYSLAACNILGVVSGGVGLHLVDLPDPNEIVVFSKTLVAVQLCWTFSLMFVKFSLLFFYIRIFSIRSFRVTAYVVMAIVTCWALSVIFETFLLCRPFKYNWDPTLPHVCGNRIASYIAAGGLNLVTDLMVLSLPIPRVWALQLPRRNKMILLAVFGVGLFVCVISILRLVALLTLTYADITFSVPTSLLWSMLEPCIGCTCACIPLMRPLFTSIFPDRLTKARRSYSYYGYIKSDRERGLKNGSGSNRSEEHELYPVNSHTGVLANEIEIHGGRSAKDDVGVDIHEPGSVAVLGGSKAKEVERGEAAPRLELGGINVKTEFGIQHY